MIALELLARAKGGEGVKSGPIGLAVILLLCIAAYFLFKSMSKHLKRVRDNFPEDTADPAPSVQRPAPTAPAASAPAAPAADATRDEPPPLPPQAPAPPPADAAE